MSDTPERPPERRRNLLLRMLITEMLDQVRELQKETVPWSPGERRQAEEALERIMTQVRAEATRQRGE